MKYKVTHNDIKDGVRHGIQFKNGVAIVELTSKMIDELKVIGCQIEKVVEVKKQSKKSEK